MRGRVWSRRLAWVVFGSAVILVCTVAPAPRAEAKRLVFQETIIEGEVQKPEVSVYLTRQNLNDRYNLELKESFLPRILKSVEKSPF